MNYSAKDLKRLKYQSRGVQRQCNDLCTRYLKKEFRSDKAKEFVRHGLCRRMMLMARCINRVFEILPPDSPDVPASAVVHDVTVHLQAFMFNTYGCLDNLAHIWVLEKNVKEESSGRAIRQGWVGLGSKNTTVWDSLPKAFTDYLLEIGDWYENIENFRHALAHRIPLYVPPGYLTDDKAVRYKDLQVRINDAVEQQDFELAEQLGYEQAALLSFHPIATHSFDENSKMLFFHAQMLSDFDTIREIASRLLPYFDR